MSASPTRSSTPPAIDPRMPDFFIVGHAKCGTTALYEMLRRHPQMFMPEYKGGAGKEPWYFARDNPHPQTRGRARHHVHRPRGETLGRLPVPVRGCRPGAARGRGLLVVPVVAHGRRADRRRATRRAHHRDHPRAGELPALASPAAAAESPRGGGSTSARRSNSTTRAVKTGTSPVVSYWPQALIYSDRVRYVEQLRRYHDLFPAEQVLVLIYDDFRADNEATVRTVLRFLDVDDGQPIEPIEVNPTIALRSTRARQASGVRCAAGSGPLLRALQRHGQDAHHPARCATRFFYPRCARALYGAPPPPDEDFMLELRRRFKGEVGRAGRVPASATSSRCGAMTTSAEPSAESPARARLPDFFIVGHSKSGTTALYEMLEAPSADLPARASRSRSYFAADLRPRVPSSAPAEPETLEEYLALFAAADPSQRAGRGLLPVPVVARGRGRDRRRTARRAHHRDPARARELPALAAPAAAAEPPRDRAGTCAGRVALERRATRRPAHSRGCAPPAGAALLRARPLRGAAAPLPRRRSRREQVLVLIYDDFRGDNEATVRKVLRFLEVDD